MLQYLGERMIRRAERQIGESGDWMRDILRVSPSAFRKFLMFMPLARHRLAAPPALYHAAHIVAAQSEDCGPCVNIAIRFARGADVDEAIITDVVRRRWDRLPEDLRLACRYAEAVATAAPEAGDLVEEMRARFGLAVLTDLALSIAAVRVFPTVKRGLGHGQSCAITDLVLDQETARHAA